MTSNDVVKNKLIKLPRSMSRRQDLKLLSAVLNASLTELRAGWDSHQELVSRIHPQRRSGSEPDPHGR